MKKVINRAFFMIASLCVLGCASVQPVGSAEIVEIKKIKIPARTEAFTITELSKLAAVANFYRFSNFEKFLHDSAEKIACCPNFSVTLYRVEKNTSGSAVMATIQGNPLSKAQFAVMLLYFISDQSLVRTRDIIRKGYGGMFPVRLATGATVAANLSWDSSEGRWRLYVNDLIKTQTLGVAFSRNN